MLRMSQAYAQADRTRRGAAVRKSVPASVEGVRKPDGLQSSAFPSGEIHNLYYHACTNRLCRGSRSSGTPPSGSQ